MESLSLTEFILELEDTESDTLPFYVDGDPFPAATKVHVKVMPRAIQVFAM